MVDEMRDGIGLFFRNLPATEQAAVVAAVLTLLRTSKEEAADDPFRIGLELLYHLAHRPHVDFDQIGNLF